MSGAIHVVSIILSWIFFEYFDYHNWRFIIVDDDVLEVFDLAFIFLYAIGVIYAINKCLE